MAARRSFITLLLIATLLLATAAVASFISVNNYWENWPLLDRISGRHRFAQFVANPIPDTVYDIHGGRSGPPRHEIDTYFRYYGDIETNAFLGDWQELTAYDSTAAFLPQMLSIGANRVYLQPADDGYRYLLISESRHKGILYIP